MDKIFEFLSRFSWKQWLTVALLALVATISSIFLTGCGLAGRVQGTRKVEKSVIHEQQYDINKDGTRVYSTRVTSSYNKVKG